MPLFKSQIEDYVLDYYLLKSNNEKMYGVGVQCKSASCSRSAFCYNLCTDEKAALDLLKLLAAASVFPSTLNDVIEDLMS